MMNSLKLSKDKKYLMQKAERLLKKSPDLFHLVDYDLNAQESIEANNLQKISKYQESLKQANLATSKYQLGSVKNNQKVKKQRLRTQTNKKSSLQKNQSQIQVSKRKEKQLKKTLAQNKQFFEKLNKDNIQLQVKNYNFEKENKILLQKNDELSLQISKQNLQNVEQYRYQMENKELYDLIQQQEKLITQIQTENNMLKQDIHELKLKRIQNCDLQIEKTDLIQKNFKLFNGNKELRERIAFLEQQQIKFSQYQDQADQEIELLQRKSAKESQTMSEENILLRSQIEKLEDESSIQNEENSLMLLDLTRLKLKIESIQKEQGLKEYQKMIKLEDFKKETLSKQGLVFKLNNDMNHLIETFEHFQLQTEDDCEQANKCKAHYEVFKQQIKLPLQEEEEEDDELSGEPLDFKEFQNFKDQEKMIQESLIKLSLQNVQK